MRKLALVLVLVAACGGKKASSSHAITVAAASDLQLAFEEITKAFHDKTGIDVTVTPGSSGVLAKQIEQGADYDVFAAASKEYVDEVIGSGCDASTRFSYARGRIVVWTSGPAPARLEDLADPKYKQIAIANPDHAPYGKAAKQALQKVGIWDKVADRIVQGESVQQAMQYAKSGNVDAGIVALGLALESSGGSTLMIDPSLYDPLDQQMVVCGKGGAADAAKQFIAFVGSPEGREIMTRYGFLLPGEAPPATPGGNGGGKGGGTGATRAPAPSLDAAAVQALVDAWLDAQNRGDLTAYGKLYADRFGGVKRVGARAWRFDRKGWLADRARMFKAPMQVTAATPDIKLSGASAIVRFEQTFEEGKFSDTGTKELVVVAGADGLRIAHEEMLASTVLAGPGSASATALPVLFDGKRWLVIGDAADPDVRATGKATMGDGGPGFTFSVRQEVAAGGAKAKLVGQTATLYPSGATCQVGAISLLTVLTPHFSVQAEWRGDADGDGTPENPALTGDDLIAAIEGGGGATYLVADVSGCAGQDGDQLGTIGAAGTVWPEVKGDALAKKALAALRALPDYATTQASYEQDYGGHGAWPDGDGGTEITSIHKSPDGKDTYVIAGARAGAGCGDFSGELIELFHVVGGKLEDVGSLGANELGEIPTTLVDANRDGKPEVAGFSQLYAWDGTTYSAAYTLDLGFRDCGC